MSRYHRVPPCALIVLLVVGLALAPALTAAAPPAKPAGKTAKARGTAPAAAGTAGAYKPGQAVEVREGQAWSAAKVTKREGRKYQVRRADGTEAWVTADQLRPAGSGRGDGERTPAATRKGAAKGAAGKAEAGAPNGDKAEAFASGARVEVAHKGTWQAATVKRRDGDLYLVALEHRDRERLWYWVTARSVRRAGSDKALPPAGFEGVMVGADSVELARLKAERQLGAPEPESAEATTAPAKPGGLSTGSREALAIAPAAFDAAPRRLAEFDPAPAPGKVARDAIPVKAGTSNQLVIAGSRALVVTTRGNLTEASELVDLAAGRSLGRVRDGEGLIKPFAYAPAAGVVLGRHYGEKDSDGMRHLDVHTIRPSAPPTLRPVVSFEPFWRENYAQVDFAAFVGGGGDHVVTFNDGGLLVVWEAAAKSAIWRTDGQRYVLPAVSPGGRQVAVLGAAGLAVHDAMTGAPLCRVPGGGVTSALAFTPDGKRVVGLGKRIVMCWDLAAGTRMPDIALPAEPGWPGGVQPIDNRFVLVGGGDLLDLDKKLVVWNYRFGENDRSGPPVVHGGRCWFLTGYQKDTRTLSGVALPHPAARAAADAIAPGQGLLLAPGGRVRLTVELEAAPELRQQIVEALTERLRQQEITVDPDSRLTLAARTVPGKVAEVTYYVEGPRNQFNVRHSVAKVAHVQEKNTRLSIEFDGQVAWERVTVCPIPFEFGKPKPALKPGEAYVSSYRYDPSYLLTAPVPSFVPVPVAWAGGSRWSAGGVTDERRPQPPPPAGVPAPVEEGDGLQ